MAAEQTTTVLNAALRRSHPRRSDHSRLPWNRLGHRPLHPRSHALSSGAQVQGLTTSAVRRAGPLGPSQDRSEGPARLLAPLESTLQPPSLALAVTPGALRKEAAAGESAQKWLPGEQNR